MLAAIVSVAAAIGIGWWQVDGPGVNRPESKIKAIIPPVQSMSFSLIDHEGASVGPKELLDRASMVFFGFTFCPDVCPTTLVDISRWLEDLGPDAERINVVFITVDPGRDTPNVLAEYVAAFHPQIRGWTGSVTEVARAAAAFRVKVKKVPHENGSYSMDHTASVMLFDAMGRFRTTIDFHEPRETALSKIRRLFRDH